MFDYFGVVVHRFERGEPANGTCRRGVQEPRLGADRIKQRIYSADLQADLLSDAPAPVSVGDHRPQDVKIRVDPLSNRLGGDVQVGQCVQLESTRLNDGNHVARRGQAIDRQRSPPNSWESQLSAFCSRRATPSLPGWRGKWGGCARCMVTGWGTTVPGA